MRYSILLLAVITSFLAKAQKLEQLGSAINTEYSELNPIISPDDKTLYFVRVSHPSNSFGTKGSPDAPGSHDVWYSEKRDDGNWTIARRMPNTINKDQFNDLFSITPDGTKILISGVYHNGRRDNTVGISMCKRTKTGWSEPEQIVIPKFEEICKGQYLTACLSNDGKTLILAFSEKKNSKEDNLFVCFLGRDGKWSKPESLGPDINTGSTETTPFLASDNYTLYFASDRKDGLGGTDIWVSKRKDRSWTKWSKPVNMGDKVNTDANEYSFTVAASGEYAYMSTKKNSVGKNDIVRFKLREEKKEEPVVAGLQTSEKSEEQKNLDNGGTPIDPNSLAPTPVVIVSGRVMDSKTGKPVQDAKIIYRVLPDGEEGEAYTNPATGIWTIVLPYGAKYSYRAEAKEFIGIEKFIDLTQVKEHKEIKNDMVIVAPIEVGVELPLNNIFFEYAKATLRPDSYPELDRIVDTMKENPNLVIEIQGHTDNVGSNESNMKLSQDRAEAVRKYLLSKKIQAARVTSVGYGETKPIATNDTEEGKAQNRRVQLAIVRK
ncbi:OmpA family protein [Emticicia sp. BO119]|uniref:OmpA family protein n=1 Tax=Emticicia sp. BO119 TaxID=2757768 RepID=UPI0015F1191F|nr:OmpA family protein [Emticicia sp. BO119]MBA4850307.1 OmpA family protein [Emticicia sp. BO119]